MADHSCNGDGFEDQCNLANWNSTTNTSDPTCGGLCPMPSISRPGGAPAPVGVALMVTSLVLFSGYCVIGAVLQHKRGETGPNLIPHRDFWASLPGDIKEGCKFTFGKGVAKVREARGFVAYEAL